MTPTTNGTRNHTPAVSAPAPALAFPQHITAVRLIPRQHHLAMAELDGWDDALATLNAALRDRAAARELLSDADRKVEIARERCRLHRAAIAVQLAAGSER